MEPNEAVVLYHSV